MAEMSINERIAKVRGWIPDTAESGGPWFMGPWDVWVVPGSGGLCRGGNGELEERNWTGSIADAWELVEEANTAFNVCVEGPVFDNDKWRCSFMARDDARETVMADAPTAPEAICLAYLAIHER